MSEFDFENELNDWFVDEDDEMETIDIASVIKDENRVLCIANSYEEKYFFNERFKMLPQQIRDELQIMCVLFTNEVGGLLILEFTQEGSLTLKTLVDDFDFYYDEIEAGLAVRKLQKDKQELLESLELFYRTFFPEDILE